MWYDLDLSPKVKTPKDKLKFIRRETVSILELIIDDSYNYSTGDLVSSTSASDQHGGQSWIWSSPKSTPEVKVGQVLNINRDGKWGF